MRSLAYQGLAAFFVLELALSAIAAEPATVNPPPNQKQTLQNLAETISAAVKHTDTMHPVFHGCIDWHSAAHGHWALLRIANTTGENDALAAWVLASLDPQKITEEAKYLREHPQFEMPYGRAWFLRLAIEYDLWLAKHPQAGANVLAEMADQVAASVEDYLKSVSPSPTSREYRNDAWALAQLADFYRHRQDDEKWKRVVSVVDDRFFKSDAAVRLGDDYRRAEFFSRFGNWAYLIAHTHDAAATNDFWKSRDVRDDELRPVEPTAGVAHHLGVNWSRAWALRAISRQVQDEKERARLTKAYLQHVKTGMAEHEKSKDDYRNYGHWVPQFAVYALTE